MALRQGDLERVLQVMEERRKTGEKGVFPSGRMRLNEVHGSLLDEASFLGGDGELNLGRPLEAIRFLQQALDMDEAAARNDPADATSRAHAARAGIAMANILRDGDPKRALAVYDVALRRLSEIHNSLPTQRDRASALASSSYALRSLGRQAEAMQRIDAAMAIQKNSGDYPADRYYFNSATYTVLCARADYAAQAGDPLDAIGQYELLLDKTIPAGSTFPDFEDAPRLSSLYAALTRLYNRAGETAKAAAMASRRVLLWQHWSSTFPNNTFVRRQIETLGR